MRQNLSHQTGIVILILYIFTYLLILPISLPSLVLCFGEDGHIAIEPSCKTTDQCNELLDRLHHLIKTHENLAPQEEDCRDVALINVSSTLYQEKTVNLKNIYNHIAAIPAVQLFTRISNVPYESNQNTYFFLTSLKSLQTMILLI
jgi:hypothetical protein